MIGILKNIQKHFHFGKLSLKIDSKIYNRNAHLSVPFRGPPRYNPRRRSGLGWGATLSRIGGPPSPCPSDHPFSSASSEGSSSHRSHEDDVSIITGILFFCLFSFFFLFSWFCAKFSHRKKKCQKYYKIPSNLLVHTIACACGYGMLCIIQTNSFLKIKKVKLISRLSDLPPFAGTFANIWVTTCMCQRPYQFLKYDQFIVCRFFCFFPFYFNVFANR